MKRTFLAFVFAAAASPFGFAQDPAPATKSTTEHHEAQSTTKTNPDGTAMHENTATHEKTDSTVNPDGSSTTTQTKRRRRTKVRRNADATGSNSTTTEHHSSTSDTTTTKPPQQ